MSKSDRMMRGIFTVLFCLCVGSAIAQVPGDYRTRANGAWDAVATWELKTANSLANPAGGADGTWFPITSTVPLTLAGYAANVNVTPTSAQNSIYVKNIVTVGTVGVPLSLTVDQVVVNNSQGRITVAAGSTFRLNNGVGTDFNISVAGALLTVNGTFILDALTAVQQTAGTVTIANGGLMQSSGATYTMANPIQFSSGSEFRLLLATGVVPTGNWNANSRCVIGAAVAGSVPASGLSQSFGIFEWNAPGQNAGNVNIAGALTTVNSNLIITSTGAGRLIFNTNLPHTLNVGGDLSISSLSRTTFTNGGASIVNVGGNFSSSAISAVGSGGAGTSTLNVTGTTTFTGGVFIGSNGTAASTINAGSDVTLASSPTLTGTTGAATFSMVINGSANFNSGTLNTTTSTGACSIAVKGDYNNDHTSGGTNFTRTGSGIVTLTFNGTSDQYYFSAYAPAFPVNYVTSATSNLVLDDGYFLAGTGNLTVNAGSSVTLQSYDLTGALQDGNVGGNVRVTGTRTYTGNIVYGGFSKQYMSVQHPGTVHTIINNVSDVDMLGSVAFTTGLVDLLSGGFVIANGSTLTLESIAYNGGWLGVDAASNITVNGVGAFGNLVLSPVPPNLFSVNNVTINRTGGGSVTQATTQLEILGTLTLTNGVFALGANTSTNILSNFSQVSGSLSGTATSTFIVSGAAAATLPASISMTGSLAALTMNRNTRTLTFNNTSANFLTVTQLTLTRGTVTNTGTPRGLRIATGGQITRVNGTLGSTVAAQSTYNVRYGNFSAATLPIGNEVPTAVGVLNNFVVANTAAGAHNVTLSRVLDVGNNLTITNGGLTTNNFAVNVGRNFAINSTDPTAFVPGSSTITFDGSVNQTFSGVGSYTINNLSLNQSVARIFTLSLPISITTSFAVTNVATTADVGSSLLTLLSVPGNTAYVPTMATGASINGDVIVQRQLPNTNGTRAYRYLTPTTTTSTVADWQDDFPVTGTFSGPSTGVYDGIVVRPTSPSLYYYSEPLVTGSKAKDDGYVKYPNGAAVTAADAPLVSGRGYATFVRIAGPITYETVGTLGQQNVPISVTHSGGTNGGFNLIGNPYPAPIQWDNVIASSSGIDNAIYFTDNTQTLGSFDVTYIDGVSSPAGYTGDIAQGQGFWVKVTNPNSSGSISFDESHKNAVEAQFIRKGDVPNLLRITLKQGTNVDHVAVRLKEGATNAFDSKYDAIKFTQSVMTVSTLSSDNQKLVINALNRTVCNSVIPVQIDGGVKGNYTLDFTGMASFESDVKVFFRDKTANKKIDLSTTAQYAFTVSDIASLPSRFELIFDGPTLQTDLAVAGEAICESNTIANVTLETSQANVKYTATLNGVVISEDIVGNGGPIQIPVSVNLLPQGDNEITISAKMLTCDAQLLPKKATLSVVKKSTIASVEGGTTCGTGSVSLSASSLDGGLYNWYEDMSDVNPIADQHSNSFVTPVISKTKTYYVGVLNALGCEGDRVAVQAVVNNMEPVVIIADGTLLKSSYATGNQWFIDGLPVAGATNNEIEANISGTYSVEVLTGGCKVASEGREMTVLGLEESGSKFINVYPNPAADKVIVEVRSSSETVQVNLINAGGIQLNTMKLSGSSDIKSGEFNLVSLPDGIYLVKIYQGKKVYTKKVSKLK